jgi:hypothetical protein
MLAKAPDRISKQREQASRSKLIPKQKVVDEVEVWLSLSFFLECWMNVASIYTAVY